jgi:hypothetical protein
MPKILALLLSASFAVPLPQPERVHIGRWWVHQSADGKFQVGAGSVSLFAKGVYEVRYVLGGDEVVGHGTLEQGHVAVRWKMFRKAGPPVDGLANYRLHRGELIGTSTRLDTGATVHHRLVPDR